MPWRKSVPRPPSRCSGGCRKRSCWAIRCRATRGGVRSRQQRNCAHCARWRTVPVMMLASPGRRCCEAGWCTAGAARQDGVGCYGTSSQVFAVRTPAGQCRRQFAVALPAPHGCQTEGRVYPHRVIAMVSRETSFVYASDASRSFALSGRDVERHRIRFAEVRSPCGVANGNYALNRTTGRAGDGSAN